MSRLPALWPDIRTHLRLARPDRPVLYFDPAVLQATARRFTAGFPGLVTFAVKSNDSAVVLENLVAAGLDAFDVASPEEMARVRRVSPTAVMHYNNPVRSQAEIRAAVGYGIRSYSVDDMRELEKLAAAMPTEGVEISVRLKLPVAGAAYDFGAKFGASSAACEALLIRAVELGFTPSMTFHPGTQCTDASAWTAYIRECAAIARRAGVRLHRLNVGGGFPSHRTGDDAPDLEAIFATIAASVTEAFDHAPALVCEPGRAMVAEAYTLCARVKARRGDDAVYLNDGIYGGLAEAAIMEAVDRIVVLDTEGHLRSGAPFRAIVFGPTCDSLDRLRDLVALPSDIDEEDYVLFSGMGAYSTATCTGFNGYGALDTVTIGQLV